MRPLAVRVLAGREFKNLIRDPRIFISFVLSLLLMPVIGLVLSFAMGAAVQAAAAAQTVAVVDMDGSAVSSGLCKWLSEKGFVVVKLEAKGEVELLRDAVAAESVALVIIRSGFSGALSSGRRPVVDVVSLVKDVGIGLLPVARVIEAIGDYVLKVLTERGGISYELVKDPLDEREAVYLVAKELLLPWRPALLTSLSMAVMLVPLLLASMSMTVMQMTATSMACENEEKTLEMLLTLPVSNYEILLSKLLGTFAVSLIGSIFGMGGMLAYFYVMFLPLAPAAQQPVLEVPASAILPSPSDVVYLAVSLLLSMFFAAALGLVVGALSKDVQIANTIGGPLSLMTFLPAMVIVFMPSEALGQVGRMLLYALPATQPIIAAKDITIARLPPGSQLYLVVSLAASLATIYAVSKLFSLETLASFQYKLSRIRPRRRPAL